jgi:hypothetical protein
LEINRKNGLWIITRSVSEGIPYGSSLTPFEVARLSHEVAAARSCGRKPAESETKKVVSREAAAGIGSAESAVAASRLKIIICLNSVGLHPRLRAAIASRFQNGATSKLTLRVTKKRKVSHYPGGLSAPMLSPLAERLDNIRIPEAHHSHSDFQPANLNAFPT